MTVSTGPEAGPVLPTSAPTDANSPEVEGKYLNYVGHEIPWFVRLVWIIFWSASAWYVIRWLLPALQGELLSPP